MTNALLLMMTEEGLVRFAAAQSGDAIDLTVTQIGLTAAVFDLAPTLTALPGEFRRVATISGAAIGDNIVHVMLRDEEAIGYTVRGFGLFLADGTLFAVYGQETAIVEKSPLSTLFAAIDIAFPTADIDMLTFGDTNFLLPPATTETAGVVELATSVEVDAGVDPRRVPSIFDLARRLADLAAELIAAIADAVADYIPLAQKGQSDGVATLDADGLVPSAQLPLDRYGEALRIGIADDRAVTPAAIAALTDRFAGFGEFQLPGVIVKTGFQNGPFTEGDVPVDFATAFPNGCRAVFITVVDEQPALNVTIYRRTKRVDGFVAYVSNPTPTDNQIDGFDWIAIGN